jgi:hypothetical protein
MGSCVPHMRWGGGQSFQTQPHIFFSKLLTLKSGDAACSEQLLHLCQKVFASVAKPRGPLPSEEHVFSRTRK